MPVNSEPLSSAVFPNVTSNGSMDQRSAFSFEIFIINNALVKTIDIGIYFNMMKVGYPYCFTLKIWILQYF
ncbi:hypothetical protein PanWU01x14_140390 [Parasponia andersonii]|uniref:Uncharacterized protein n=1 Tax=Parasponia andersonii TaxID=3476 RepID=A0A2P5CMB5_PARAD|nr:hypothetical protein PanWU01x14_140390 [Parasponia andersonii]